MTTFMRVATCLWLVSFCSPTTARENEQLKLALDAKKVFEKHCVSCHQGPDADKDLEILKRDKLVEDNKGHLVPGNPEKSSIYTTMKNGKMPKAKNNDGNTLPRPTPDEIDTVKRWIAAGASDFNAKVKPREFISDLDVLTTILKDLNKIPNRKRKYIRYFTLANLHNNSDRSETDLMTAFNAVSLLINSLSWQPGIVVPQSIDPTNTILRIDLRDYGWTEKTWNRLLAANPYGLTYPLSNQARNVYYYTGSSLPYIRGDWFVRAASRPQLYHDLLDMPAHVDQLAQRLGVNLKKNIEQDLVARAAFTKSGVSKNNRLIERHKSFYGYFWISYDFASNSNEKNLLENPFGPGKSGYGTKLFIPDGGEIIFSLPNHLNGYMIIDQNGKRINDADPKIVTPPVKGQNEQKVTTPISCFHCHSNRGLIEATDEVRAHVFNNGSAFSKEEREIVEAIYPDPEQMNKLFAEDVAKYKTAWKLAVPFSTPSEPISFLALLFDSNVDLNVAAAELGLKPEELREKLNTLKSDLARSLGTIRVSGQGLQRETFKTGFNKLAEEVQTQAKFLLVEVPASQKQTSKEIVALQQQPTHQAAPSADHLVQQFEHQELKERDFAKYQHSILTKLSTTQLSTTESTAKSDKPNTSNVLYNVKARSADSLTITTTKYDKLSSSHQTDELPKISLNKPLDPGVWLPFKGTIRFYKLYDCTETIESNDKNYSCLRTTYEFKGKLHKEEKRYYDKDPATHIMGRITIWTSPSAKGWVVKVEAVGNLLTSDSELAVLEHWEVGINLLESGHKN